MSDFDLLIVGAGPAGSFAAELLARQGARVALFDGRPPGEPKACGGGITAKALKAWPHLLNAVGRRIHELDLYSPAGKQMRLKLDDPFVVYSRLALDCYLRERARDAGAHVFAEKISTGKIKRTDGAWRIASSSGEWAGSVLVGADGANSAIAKMLAGPLTPSDMGVALGYRVPLPDHGNFQTVIAFLPGWDGYVWAFPGTDCVSIGIATSQPTFNHERLEAMLLDFIDRYYQQRWNNTLLGSISKAQVKTLRAEIELRADRYAARIPNLDQSTLKARRLVGSDWALIGDAAGFADAITGEGIYYALRSAELFAESYLKGNAEEYETRWRTEFGEELMRAAKLRSTFYGKFFGNTFTHRMIQCSILHPGIRRTLVELIAGDLPYSQLKRTLVRRLVST